MCHKTEHKSWLETKHAKAYETLKPEDRKKDSCIVCHITGFGVADTVFEGVQCEACHGPGSLYKSMKIMNKKKYKADRETRKPVPAAIIKRARPSRISITPR